MALQEVDRIIDILKTAHQQKMVEQEGKRRQEEQESLAQNRLAVRDQADKAFQQHIKDQEAQQKIAQQAADLQMKVYKLHGAQALQQMGEEYQKTGVAPGGQAAPMATSSTGGDFSPANPQQATGAQLTIPGMEDLGSIQVATPERAAARQADLTRITQRPKVEAQIEESRALQADMLNKQTEAKQADLDRANAIKAADESRLQLQLDAQEKRAQAHDKILLTIAGMRAKKGVEPTIDIEPHVQDVLDGRMSLEDFQKTPLAKIDKEAISEAVTQAGGRFLTKNQQELNTTVNGAAEALTIMKDFIDKTSFSDSTVGAITGAVNDYRNADIRKLNDQIKGRKLVMAQAITKQSPRSISDKDAESILQGYTPTLTDTTKNKIIQYDKYVDILNKKVETELAPLKPAQAARIKASMGFPFKHYDGNKVQQPAQNQPAAPGATHMWTPQGIQPVGAGK